MDVETNDDDMDVTDDDMKVETDDDIEYKLEKIQIMDLLLRKARTNLLNRKIDDNYYLKSLIVEFIIGNKRNRTIEIEGNMTYNEYIWRCFKIIPITQHNLLNKISKNNEIIFSN